MVEITMPYCASSYAIIVLIKGTMSLFYEIWYLILYLPVQRTEARFSKLGAPFFRSTLSKCTSLADDSHETARHCVQRCHHHSLKKLSTTKCS